MPHAYISTALIGVLAVATASAAVAQGAASGRPSSASHDLLQFTRSLRLEANKPKPREAEVTLELGVANDRDQSDVSTLTTPFDITWKPQGERGWVFDLAGDGFTRAHDPGDPDGSGRGVASPTFKVARDLVEGMTVQFGITAPPTSAPGSGTASQRMKIVSSAEVDSKRWTLQGGASLKHDDHPTAATSAWKGVLLGSVARNLAGGSSLQGGISWSHRGGTHDAVELSAEWDHVFSKRFTGVAQVTRGVTSGSRHGTLECDGIWTFQ